MHFSDGAERSGRARQGVSGRPARGAFRGLSVRARGVPISYLDRLGVACGTPCEGTTTLKGALDPSKRGGDDSGQYRDVSHLGVPSPMCAGAERNTVKVFPIGRLLQ